MEGKTSIYDSLDGEAGVRALVQRFYQLMDELPEARELRLLHPEDLERSANSLFMFFSGWFGGPPLYVNERGHPRLRMRHFPFSIGARERDEWLWCMDRALDEQEMPHELREHLRVRFHQLADHMRNRED